MKYNVETRFKMELAQSIANIIDRDDFKEQMETLGFDKFQSMEIHKGYTSGVDY